jgi:hypothetical protein
MDYGAGIVCGGSVNLFKGLPYRSFEGGVAKLERDLTIDKNSFVGSSDNSNVYSVETINNRLFIGTYDGYVKIINEDNLEIASYKVGAFPGDFEYWTNLK